MVALLKMPSRLTIPIHEGSPAAASDPNHERRMFPRRRCEAQVHGRRLDHTLDARQQPRLSLVLQDLSLGGLAAIADRPVETGEHLTVHFPPPDPLNEPGRPTRRLTTSTAPARTPGGWDAYGRVIRCQPTHNGYAIAVAFDPLPAA